MDPPQLIELKLEGFSLKFPNPNKAPSVRWSRVTHKLLVHQCSQNYLAFNMNLSYFIILLG